MIKIVEDLFGKRCYRGEMGARGTRGSKRVTIVNLEEPRAQSLLISFLHSWIMIIQ